MDIDVAYVLPDSPLQYVINSQADAEVQTCVRCSHLPVTQSRRTAAAARRLPRSWDGAPRQEPWPV